MTATNHDASFWTAAWALSRTIDSLESVEEARHVVPQLHDRNMQAYLFGWRRVDTPHLLQAMVEGGLLDDSSGRPWPLVTYLEQQVAEQPTLVAEAVVRASAQASSDLLQDLLGIAVQLPSPVNCVVCADLTKAWLRSDAQWFDATVWIQVLRCLSVDAWSLQSLAGEVLYSAIAVSTSEYELSEILDAFPSIQDGSSGTRRDDVTDALLDGLETALAAHLVMSDHYSKRLTLTDLVEASADEPAGRLVRKWLELDSQASEPKHARSLRLLDYSEPVIQQLGLRTLQRSLDWGPKQQALAVLGQLVLQGRFMDDHAVRPELLRLVSWNFESLDEAAQVVYVERALAAAEAADYPNRYLARDMLGAVRDDLGPRELRSLRMLETELGQYSPDVPSFRVSAGWVESDPAFSLDTLRNMSTADVWALLRQQAQVESGFDAERARFELTQSLRQLATLRPEELLAEVDKADTIADVAVHASLVDGFADAVANGARGELAPLLRYFIRVYTRTPGPEGIPGRMAVVRAVLTLLEAASDEARHLVLTAQEMTMLSSIVRQALGDESPSADDASGWTASDLPTASLNVVRGIAVRAAFHLTRLQGFGSRSGAVSSALTKCLSGETNAAVLAAFGAQLPVVLTGPSQKLAEVFTSRLEEDGAWSVLFSSYLLTRPASSFDDELVVHFERAVKLASRGAELGPELMAAWPSLLRHVLGRYLFSDNPSWGDVALPALDAATPPQHSAALRGLGNALRRNPDIAIPTAGLLRLAQHALTGQRGHEGRPEVAMGALQMLTAARVPVSEAGRLLQSLTQSAGQAPYRDLIPMLIDEASEVPGTVARVLRAALDVDAKPWELRRFSAELVELMRLLAASPARPEAEELVEVLGREGFFFIEPAAFELLEKG